MVPYFSELLFGSLLSSAYMVETLIATTPVEVVGRWD